MNTDKQKGVSLIITFFIMIIILSVVLSISILLYSEIKVIRNIGNSVVGFYAADSGIEKVLYYDKQVLPPLSEDQATGKTTYVKTGLCSIFSLTNPDGSISSNYCTSVHDHSADESIYCDPLPGDAIPVITGNDCDPSTCTDCEISFGTSFGNGATYTTTAKVYPSGSSSIFEIESKGNFRDAGRQIEALNTSILPKDVIQIENACMTPQPPSYSQGEPFFISADVSATSSTDRIGTVTAIIKNSSASSGNVVDTISLDLAGGDHYQATWIADNVGVYYVDLDVTDTSSLINPYHQKCTNIQSGSQCLGLCNN